jgi:hypothetical protein
MILPTPFPIASGRYEVGPGMRRFGQAGAGFPAEEGHFQPDANLGATLLAKLAVLRRAPRECHLVSPVITPADEIDLRQAIAATFALLAAEHPRMATLEPNGVILHHLGLKLTDWSAATPQIEQVGPGWAELRAIAPQVREWLTGCQGLFRLGDALGLAVQEDLAIVRGPAAAAGDVLEWTHVCLPSGWSPAEKIGRSFGAVHAPVAHSEPLLASQHQIVRAMIQAGPFVRYVWGLHPDDALCHNPRLHRAAPWAAASPAELAQQVHFRVERQTTHGFPGLNRALFTIRYWVEPLFQTALDPWQRERLASALGSMDEESLRYKGLTEVCDRLLNWLRQ